jgi:hypothetical protein
VIDLAETDEVGWNIAISHLWRSSSKNAVECVLLSLTFSQEVHLLSTQESIYGSLPLHWAAMSLWRNCERHTSFMNSTSDEATKSIRLTISTLLKAGADVHAVDFRGNTSLSHLVTPLFPWSKHEVAHSPKVQMKTSGERLSKWFSWWLVAWFDLLREAGYDLKQYIRKERDLDLTRQVYPRLAGDYWKMKTQERPEEDAIIVHFEFEDWLDEEEQEETEMRVPGAYPKTSDVSADYVANVCERGDVSFFIGPLKGGIQECIILNWLDVYYYGGR